MTLQGTSDNEFTVFVSYSRADVERARRVVDVLRTNGIAAWWDQDIPAGEPWEEVIEKELERCKLVLVLWSRASVRSSNVKAEARYALKKQKLYPALLDRSEPPVFFAEHQGVRLFTPVGGISERGLAALLDRVGQAPRSKQKRSKLIVALMVALGLVSLTLCIVFLTSSPTNGRLDAHARDVQTSRAAEDPPKDLQASQGEGGAELGRSPTVLKKVPTYVVEGQQVFAQINDDRRLIYPGNVIIDPYPNDPAPLSQYVENIGIVAQADFDQNGYEDVLLGASWGGTLKSGVSHFVLSFGGGGFQVLESGIGLQQFTGSVELEDYNGRPVVRVIYPSETRLIGVIEGEVKVIAEAERAGFPLGSGISGRNNAYKQYSVELLASPDSVPDVLECKHIGWREIMDCSLKIDTGEVIPINPACVEIFRIEQRYKDGSWAEFSCDNERLIFVEGKYQWMSAPR